MILLNEYTNQQKAIGNRQWVPKVLGSIDKKRKLLLNGHLLVCDYLSICSPNYLHDAPIRFGMRNLLNVICEKPLILNPWNLDALQEIEQDTSNKFYSILQLGLHPSIIATRNKIKEGPTDKMYNIYLSI